jgi:acetyl esterase/lipase
MKLHLVLLTAMLVGSPISAQPPRLSEALAAPAEPNAIPLGTGGVPDMPPESWFGSSESPRVRNVSRATLTPFLPDKARATGAAVIVAPGGAFALLAIEKEGWTIAKSLADRGIAAFVLKYRLNPTPADPAEALRQQRAAMAQTSAEGRRRPAPGDLSRSVPPQALEDARAALRLVRSHARDWNIDPRRIGMMGFSAGAITTLGLVLASSPEDQPAFIAPMYPPMDAQTVPPSAPPMFVGIASDDPLFGASGFGLIESWQAAKRPVELHYYQQGGHGFGPGIAGTTTAFWLQGFVRWLEMNRMIEPRPTWSER